MTSILAIHAHPDDIETLCAGTLALLAAGGHRLVIATVTAGDCGSGETSAAETARIRKSEAAAAAAMIGAAYRCVGVGDLAVFNDDPTRRLVTETIRWARPEIVITSAPADYHPDHEATSMLVRDACFAAPAPNYRAGDSAPLNAIPHLYYMDPIGGRDRDGNRVAPEFGVNIEAWFETKQRMLSAHESQTSWLKKHHNIDDPLEAMTSWSRRRGKHLGVTFGEGFRQYRHEPYPTDARLQDLIGASLVMV